jgi:hypothetical protein
MMSGRCTLSLQINVRVTRHVRTGNAIRGGPAKLAGGRGAAADSRLFQPPACKKNRCFSQVCAAASVLHRSCGTSFSLALRVQECFMSFSVNGSNASNPFAQWQALLQQDTSTSSSAQSDPTASLLAALGQGQSTGTTASSGGAESSSTSSAATSGNSSPQFGAQTLQTLFDMQANAAPSDGATSSSSNTAGSANVANNNLLERLIQMQAQLINPATAQNVATA